MADYQRTIRQQAIREAEGYLDLAMGLGEQWPLAPELQTRLAIRALDALNRLGDESGEKARVLHLTGCAYRVMRQHEDAIPPLLDAANLDPENISIWLTLAWCYKRTGRLDRAIKSLENALAVDSQEAILHFNLACYWSLSGDAKTALKYLTRSFDIDPAYRELVRNETDLDPIRDLPDFQSLIGAIA